MVVPVALCIDIEPDDRSFDPRRPSAWDGFEPMARFLDSLRGPLADRSGEGVRFTWFVRMDPQVAEGYGRPDHAVRAFGARLDGLRSRGDALGLHMHAPRWEPDRGVWIIDHGDPSWVEHVIDSSLEAYRRSMGEPCRLTRFGDRFMTTAAMAALGRAEVLVDLTVEPGEPPVPSGNPGEDATGTIHDYRQAPREPYQPSDRDFLEPVPEPRPGRLWEMPLTAAEVRYPFRHVRRLGQLAFRPMALAGAVGRRLRTPPEWRPSRDATLRPYGWPGPPSVFWDVVERRVGSMDRPCLAFAIRSDTPLRPALWSRVRPIMEALVHHPLGERLVFCHPDEGLRRLGYPV